MGQIRQAKAGKRQSPACRYLYAFKQITFDTSGTPATVLLLLLRVCLGAFKHQQRNPAEHLYTFKRSIYRLYRLLMLQFEKVSGNSTDETDETLL